MNVLLLFMMISTYLMVLSKRVNALVHSFTLQSFLLFSLALSNAIRSSSHELYYVAGLILVLKVFLLPYFLLWMAKKINVDENLGLILNPMLSLVFVSFLSYGAYRFAFALLQEHNLPAIIAFTVSLAVILTGLFIMIFRVKAFTQVIGLLVVENGLFLATIALCGNMPFFVEIAIFFDLFVCVIIMGVFIYRINKLFTHIDVDKLTSLKG